MHRLPEKIIINLRVRNKSSHCIANKTTISVNLQNFILTSKPVPERQQSSLGSGHGTSDSGFDLPNRLDACIDGHSGR